jgi:hypothetical protein
MNKKYYINYKLADGQFRIYNNETGELTTEKEVPKKFRYYLPTGCEASDKGLIAHAKEFNKCAKEMYNDKDFQVHYTSYHNDHTAVELVYKKLCYKKYKDFSTISNKESGWYEKCYNAGLFYCDPRECNTYSYDFSANYPRIMSSKDFVIPTSEGKECTLKKLPKDVKTGIYRVAITCDHKDIKKVFSFSKNNTYVDITLKFALKYQKKFNIKIELVQDGEPNAYIYDSVTTGSTLFSYWFFKLLKLKTKYPGNFLVKRLMSSLWGHIVQFKTINKSWADIEAEGLKIGMTDKCDYIIKDFYLYDKQEYYELQDVNQPYKYNIRLKPFLSAYARIKTAEIALLHLSKVVRIHTDCISFRKQYEFKNEYYLSMEAKTTGLINWKHVNSYDKLCKCNKMINNKDRNSHKLICEG